MITRMLGSDSVAVPNSVTAGVAHCCGSLTPRPDIERIDSFKRPALAAAKPPDPSLGPSPIAAGLVLDLHHLRRNGTRAVTSVVGTFRTCRDFRVESAFGGKAEVRFRARQGQLLAQSGHSASWPWPLSANRRHGPSDASPNRAARLIFCNISSAASRRQHTAYDTKPLRLLRPPTIIGANSFWQLGDDHAGHE